MSQEVRVVYKKRGGLGAFFLGFLFSLLFIVGSVVGAGFWAYNSLTPAHLEKWLGIEIPVEGDFKNQPLKKLIEYGLELIDGYVNVTIEDLPNKYKINLPDSIPGTGVSLTPVYSSEISFKGSIIEINKIKIIDIANNLDEFITGAKTALFNNVYVSNFTNFIGIDLTELNYPIFTDDTFFNVGTSAAPVYKGLLDLNVTQVLDIMPEYFASDNMTFATIERALGLSILPAAPAEGADPYSYLRDVSFVDFTIPALLDNVTFGMALDLLYEGDSGLNLAADFAFMNNAEFRNLPIANAMDYVNNDLKLSDIISTPATLAEATTSMERILFSIGGLTVGDILNDSNALLDALMNSGLTLGGLLGNGDTTGVMGALNDVALADLFGGNPASAIEGIMEGLMLSDLLDLEGTILESLAGKTFSNFVNFIDEIPLADIFPAGSTNAVILAILDKPNATVGNLETIIDDLTIADVFGSSPTGALSLIPGTTKISDLGGANFDLESRTINNLIQNGLLPALVNSAFDQSGTSPDTDLANVSFGQLLAFLQDPATMILLKTYLGM